MHRRVLVIQVCVIVLMSQLGACNAQSPASPVPAPPTAVSASTTVPAQPSPPLELIWKTTGDPSPFKGPVGITVDAQENIYVMDAGNSRVQKFDTAGNFLLMWGSEGSGDGQFQNDTANRHSGRLAVDSQGNVYVLDTKNFRVQKFDTNGGYLAQWGTEGDGEGQFRETLDIAIDQQDNVYVSDLGNNTVQKFAETGKFLLRWGGEGYNDGEFTNVGSVAIVPDGNVLVTDDTNRIQRFDSNGQFRSKITLEPIDNKAVTNWVMTVDDHGDIYIADFYGGRLVKLDPEGKPLGTWSGPDAGTQDFTFSIDIHVDEQGNIYITDSTDNLVQKFRQPTFRP